MVNKTSHTVTERKRKSRALEAKRQRAQALGLITIEGALIAIRDDTLNVLQWDGEDWVVTHASKIVPLD